tara:strand:- start:44 stop:280 length:237 start_codon:yes stop_codon:yes gene_type:complete
MESLCGLWKNVELNDEDGRLVVPTDGSVSFQLPPPTPRKTFPEKRPNDSLHNFILESALELFISKEVLNLSMKVDEKL